MKRKTADVKSATQTRSIRLERTYRATIDEVWDMWTTKKGIESWWGPDGFAVKVRKLDLRPGGVLLYAMTAVDPPQVAFMKKEGMPITTETSITFTAVEKPVRLAYVNHADFIPGVEPYDVATVVELSEVAGGVRLVLSFDAMHDDVWTERQTMGWQSELDKLGQAIARLR